LEVLQLPGDLFKVLSEIAHDLQGIGGVVLSIDVCGEQVICFLFEFHHLCEYFPGNLHAELVGVDEGDSGFVLGGVVEWFDEAVDVFFYLFDLLPHFFDHFAVLE
jgi:hypothetical protein